MSSIVDDLRAKPSRDNRELFDRAADEIERLRRELTELRQNCYTADAVERLPEQIAVLEKLKGGAK